MSRMIGHHSSDRDLPRASNTAQTAIVLCGAHHNLADEIDVQQWLRDAAAVPCNGPRKTKMRCMESSNDADAGMLRDAELKQLDSGRPEFDRLFSPDDPPTGRVAMEGSSGFTERAG